jgi:hypothetical protein
VAGFGFVSGRFRPVPIRPIVVMKEPTESFLQQLLRDCQDWYNEVVQVIAKMIEVIGDPRDEENLTKLNRVRLEGLNFVYVNTRTYLPRVLSARRLLADFSGTDALAAALDSSVQNLSHI